MKPVLLLRLAPDAVLDEILPRIRRRWPRAPIRVLETSSRPSRGDLPVLRLARSRLTPADLRRALARSGGRRAYEAVVLPYNEADLRPFDGIERAVLDAEIPLFGIDARRDKPAAARRRFFAVTEAVRAERRDLERLLKIRIRPMPDAPAPMDSKPRDGGALRISVVADLSIPHVASWCERMRDLGCRITVFTPRSRIRIRGVRVVDLGWPENLFLERLDLFSAWWARRLERKGVRANDLAVAFFTGLVPATMCGLRPLVAATMGSDLLTHPTRHAGWRGTLRAALRCADFATTFGSPLLARALTRLDFPARRIYRGMEGGLDFRRLLPGPSPSRRAPIVAYVRGWNTIYRSETLLAAIPLVHRKRPDVRFVLAGPGTPVRIRLPRTEIHGLLPASRIAFLLRRATLFVSTAVTDATPRSLFEAMALGAIPILTDLPAYRPWIRDGRNGRTVRAEDPPALAEAILAALSRAAAGGWDLAARRNRARMEREFDLARNDAALLAAYRRLASPRRGV